MSLLLVQYRGGRNTPADEKHAKGGRMAEVLLFHHAQGQTKGFAAFADDLRRSGPFDGRTFPSVEAGMAYAEQLDFLQDR
jgi:hypothetical protein